MTTRKLLIMRLLEDQYLTKIKAVIPDWEIYSLNDSPMWEEHITDAEVIIGWKRQLREPLLNPGSKLKWLQTWSAGVNYLPLNDLEAQEVAVTSANGVHAYPISETIFGLLLASTRKIDTYIKNQEKKHWDESNIKLEIHQKTIGIIGVGAIGLETAKIAKAFSMTVLGVRQSSREEQFVDEMYTIDELHKVLPRCDYIVVTLPLTKETENLFGADQFKLMKNTAFFINIGRGNIVDENALIHALEEKEIGGAGLDVFVTEPLPKESPLWEMENVIITPHSSGSTENYSKRVIEDIFIPNLKNYIEGNKPSINLVNYTKGY